MTKWTCKPNPYQLVAIALLMLSACSNEPLPENSNLADTTTLEQSVNTNGTETTDSPIAQRVKTLVSRTLLSLNQSINQGQLLSAQQESCIGAFDPALGESLLSIDCDQPLATGDVVIYVETAAFAPSDDCHADVLANQTNSCSVDYAELTVTTLWTQALSDNTQESRRPVPIVGASISYGMQPDLITIKNLPAALGGTFDCHFDINTLVDASSGETQNCDQLLQELINLIDLHLS